MRGNQLQNNEFYKAYYYAPIATIVNNHKQYTWDTQPQVFKFSDSSTESTTVFQSLKGIERKTVNLSGVFQTSDRKWKIITHNSVIDFQENAKVVIKGIGFSWEFFVTKVTAKASDHNSLKSTRSGLIDLKSLPKILDLA